MPESTTQLISFLIIATLLILSLVGFTIFILFLYQKKQDYYAKTMASIELEHEKNLLKTQLEIQEETFLNISREIHDNIGLALTLAKLQLNSFTNSSDDKSKGQLDGAIGLITKAISDLSDISKSLNSDVITQIGWLKLLELECEKLNKMPPYRVTFRVQGIVVFLESTTELILYRIAQEALNNILKHSGASEIHIVITFDQQLELRITDNGKGFIVKDKTQPGNQHMRLGLTNMSSRAKLINGKLTIQSESGVGTTVSVKIPLESTKNIFYHDQNSISRRSYTSADSTGILD